MDDELFDTPTNRRDKLMVAAAFWLCIAIALLWGAEAVLYRALDERRLASVEQLWPSVQATILSEEVRDDIYHGEPVWFPVWTYTYEVAGRSYQAGSVDLSGGSEIHRYATRALAENEAVMRSPGLLVTAFYDPNDPARSVLDRRTQPLPDWALLALSFFLFVLSMCGFSAVCYWYLRRNGNLGNG